MGLKDPHDPRLFRRFVKLDPAGTVVAIIERADGAADPIDAPSLAAARYFDVSDLYPFDFTGVTIAATTAKAIKAELASKNKVVHV